MDASKQYLGHEQQSAGMPSLPSSTSNLSNGSNGNSNGNNSSSVDSLTCQWQNCRERCESPEALYDHVCERHVGRKSTNNLNLQCQWGSCRTTTVKRDHITSHIRVHVPLKPHKCEFCGKSFKRPQDLKKHVKTHADESVLHSPDARAAPQQRMMPASQYQTSSQKPTNGYYPPQPQMQQQPHSSYGYPAQATNNYGGGHYGATAAVGGGGASYGPVYYNTNQMHQGYNIGVDSRKRGFNELNSFFGDAKRSRIQPNQYMDLGSRFGDVATMGLSNGFGGGFGGGYDGYNNGMMDAGAGVAYQTAQHPASFGAPFPELKTKNDLLSLESFLDQLSHTVYEQPEHGLLSTHPLAPITNLPTTYRTSHSPPHMQAQSSYNNSVSSASGTPFSHSMQSTVDDSTPALTPSSYQASQSPASSANHASPLPRSAGAAAYPSLPSFSNLDHHANMPGAFTGNTAPVSSLGSAFEDGQDRRRYSGGYLQRAATATSDDSKTITPTSPSEASRRSSTSAELVKGFQRTLGITSSSSPKQDQSNVKLPGVADITRTSSQSSHDGDKAEDENKEAWVRNIKVIEALQQYIKGRIERGEFEIEGKSSPKMKHEHMETVREVETSEEANEKERERVVYPDLRMETTA